MKLLMLKQPWLNLIIHKLKTLETRRWKHNCNYRGEILLASSQVSHTPAQVKSIMSPDQFHKFNEFAKKIDYDIYHPKSCAGCVVNMTDYRPMNALEDVKNSFVAYHPDLKILDFENIRPVVSFPVKGMLGLLNLPPAYERQIQFG